MTPTLLTVVDQAATVLWVAGVQFALFGTALAVPLWLWRRRAVVRHQLAVAAIVGSLLSPLTAVVSLQWGFDWIPVPAWALPKANPTAAVVEPPRPPIDQSAPLTDAAASTAPATESPASHPPVSSAFTPRSDAVPAARDETALPAPLPLADASLMNDAASADTATVAVPQRTHLTESNVVHVTTASERSRWPGVLLAVWLAGVVLLAIRTAVLKRRVGRLVSTTRPATAPHCSTIVRQVASETGLSAPPAVLVSDIVTNPFVTGLRRPRLVLPAALLEAKRGTALSHVLLHEFCHVARGDLWFAALVSAARTLCWPHPMVHLYAAVVSRSREELCDDRVLESVAATDYSRTLLTLSERSRALPAALALFPHRESLSARIARLLDPHRDRSLRLNGRQRLLAAIVVAVAASAAIGIGTSTASDDAENTGNQPAAKDELDTDQIVRDVASRSVFWLAPPPALKQLEYDYVLGTDVTPVAIKRGDRRPRGVWFGATLHTGFHKLTSSPERFDVTATHADDDKTITLVASPKNEQGNITIDAGNGIEGTWRGYFSHSAPRTTIVIDADRLVPLEEQSGGTTFRYSEWQEVAAGRWVPRQIEVIGHGMHWRMRFDWLGDAAWLLTSSESISPEATTAVVRTRNVRVNGKAVVVPLTDAQKASREAAKELLAMLDHNRPWLDGGETGAGWKPPFETLSYTFHTVREDVRETCILTRDGVALFEVVVDSQGKMRDGGRRRKIALDTPHHATSKRGDRFARIFQRSKRERDQPIDLALKHYARIGCQFDLPLFRYQERLDTASVTVKDGEWNGQPCRVATVTNLGGDVPLGCGTMLGFSSRSYVHHIMPSQEVLYIDPERNVVLHETLTSSREGKTFEIDFGDFTEVEPGQWAPRSILIEAKDYFTCEYRFQFVAGRHWMLEEVVSWFEHDNKSRGVIVNVAIDGNRTLLDETVKQVEASRTLFSGAGEPSKQVGVATVPFALGEPIDIGPYELKVSVASVWKVVVAASTNDPNAPGVVPLVFLDEKHRPLFAPSISLTEKDGVRQGSVELGGSSVWKAVTSIAVPVGGTKQVPVKVVPLEWGKMLSLNVPDSKVGDGFIFNGTPDEGSTRVFRVQADWSDERSTTVMLDLVSIDGMQEFNLDLSAALLDESGKLITSGHHAGSIRVESDPVEQRVVIDLGKLPPGTEPAYLAIGVAPGDVISAPAGTLWATFFDTSPPFDIEALLAASDESCWRVGLVALGERETNESIEHEFFGDRVDERRVGDGKISRRTLLRPHVAALVRILKESESADVQAAAVRYLAYAEADNAVTLLKPFVQGDSSVREAAAVGLTFLGQSGLLDALRDVLAGKQPSLDDVERSVWKAARNREQDTLIALTHSSSDAAVDLLGETLSGDLESARPITDEKGRTRLEGRTGRAQQIITLLGRTGNPRSVVWLTKAADLIDRRDDLDEHFERDGLARSLLWFKEQAQDRILAEIESGDDAGTWLYVIKESRDATFLPTIRQRLASGDLTAWETRSAVLYLWNLHEPEAVEALREVYERGTHKDDRRAWMTLCEALAAKGDARGLNDAYAVLVELERPAMPPTDEEEHDDWEDARDDDRGYAEDVFRRATPEMIVEFVNGKTQVESPAEQRVVLTLLWKLPELPEPFAAVVPRWAENADGEIAKSAARLLDRD
ncbi:MAG: M56 family metallopeptidase [Planctomycetaceae bacterium]